MHFQLRLFLGAVFAAACPGQDREVLEEAREKLRGPKEDTVRQGAELCLEQNNSLAMDLLLDVLRGSQPHHRDIVWEVLPQFSDADARELLVKELHGARDERVRQWCAEALGRFGDLSLAPALEKALADRESVVRTAAARSLGQLRHAPAVKKLLKRIAEKSPMERAVVMEALARIDAANHRAAFLEGLHDADGGVRCALLGVLPELYPADWEARPGEFLADPDWRVRLQAVEHLTGMRSIPAMDLLVAAVADARPVVRRAAMSFLREVSGLQYDEPRQWQDWWRSGRDTFSFEAVAAAAAPEPRQGGTVARFHGLDVASDHVTFVLDKSHDMGEAATDGAVKDRKASQEIDATLGRLLEKGFHFNVVTFGAKFQALSETLVPLDARSHGKAMKFLGDIRPEGSKAIWDVLERTVTDPECDTIFLLSSGEPEIGLYVHYNRVTEHLRELNRFHKTTIHTVAYTDSKWYQDQLRHISSTTGGSFVARP